MPSLLRSEAVERARLVRVGRVLVELDLTDSDSFASRTTIDFAAQAGESTFCEFRGEALLSAHLNGRELSPDCWVDGRIHLTSLQEDNTLEVEGRMAWSGDGEGLYRHVDPLDGATYCYAMSFLDAAPRWFACFDQPDLKAPHEFWVTAPQDWLVRGNGPAERLPDGRWRVAQRHPLSTYFVTLVAGHWAEVETEHDGIRLSLLSRQSMASQLQEQSADVFAVTRTALDAFHRLFGVRYPFGDYQQVFAPDFNAGAMENPGCVLLRDQYLFRGQSTELDRATRAGTIVHEMAHQWFGDLVTMRWWDDLWLNESFAEYMAHRVCSDSTSYPLWTEFGLSRKDWGLVADQAPSSHPVAVNGSADARSALANFDGISYAKGAGVLRQLAALLGDEVFLGGLRDHFEQHAFGNADLADLLQAWQRRGATGLDDWSAQWLQTQGVDLLSVELSDETSGDGGLALVRIIPEGHPANRSHAVRVDVVNPDGGVAASQSVVVRDQRCPVDDLAQAARRPGHVVVPDAGDQSWARVRPSDWQLPISRIEKVETQVVVWNGLRDAVRSADLDPAVAFDLCCRELPSSRHDLVLRSVGSFVSEQLCGPFCPPSQREDRRERWSGILGQVLDDSAPGSDRQLIAWRQLLVCTGDVELLLDWLDGRRLPAGRSIDADLRWEAVVRLVTLGHDPVVVDEELARDSSAEGHRAATRARACRPTASAKWEALELVTEQRDSPAYTVYAAAEGIFRPEHHELTAPLVEPWFERIAGTATLRQGWALGTSVLRGFPMTHVSPETLALTRRELARDDLDPAIRRSLADAGDDLARALASLQRYGS